ncbi:MAG: hypothetical protein EA392_03130 [Cryomorphaceae bacterium]|nr:MAG: hypothetical protein EA392_03130 [Cryomorphaceae bacterium]
MKHTKTIFAGLIFTLIAQLGMSQMELGVSYGYRFGGSLPVRVDNQFGKLKVEDSGAFSADFRYRVGGSALLVAYSRQSSTIDFVQSGLFGRERLFDANIEYFLLGVSRGRDNGIGFNPFGQIALGIGVITPLSTAINSEIRPAVTMRGGFNYFFTEMIGLRVSVGILAPLQYGNAGIFCDSASGCGVGVGASSQIVQGDLSGGLVFRFGNRNRNLDDAYDAGG